MNNIEHEQQDSSESSNMNAQSMLSVKCNSVTLLGKYVDSRVSTATMSSCVFSKKVCPPCGGAMAPPLDCHNPICTNCVASSTWHGHLCHFIVIL